MLTDIEISQNNNPWKISEIAESLHKENEYIPYGWYKAKLPYDSFGDKNGKLILVTAINPTPLGEGKTTMSIGLADGLHQLDKNVMLCLREPSLGPVFGIKGGATGGGYSQVVPMEDINLHFTGDLHAIENANNLLAAMIDNHVYQGNDLKIKRVTWRRCMDMNDRQLRKIECGLGNRTDGVPRGDGFDITVASEVMAIFCLSSCLDELQHRLGDIIIGYNDEDQPVFAHQLGAEGAMTALLKDAFNPNLVQTLEHTPALIHGGPFANIAHGCNSVVATKLGLSLADYVITEAGFGADLGAEKFLDIKCLQAGLTPSAIVLVVTTKALRFNGGASVEEAKEPNLYALKRGICNLNKHLENLKFYNIPIVVTINKYSNDSEEEIEFIKSNIDVPCEVCTSFIDGGKGAINLAETVLANLADPHDIQIKRPYDFESEDIKGKMKRLAYYIYGAKDVKYSEQAEFMINKITEMGYASMPICVAKTQYSFSDDPKLLGAPFGFTMTVNEVRLSAGAGFIVLICGKIMTMPGLPKVPAAERIGVDAVGNIFGVF